jgi:hypothetical protein
MAGAAVFERMTFDPEIMGGRATTRSISATKA